MIDMERLNEDRSFLKSLDIDFEGLEDDRVLRILQTLQVANRNTDRWRIIAQDLIAHVTELLAEKKHVTIDLPSGVKVTCDATAVGEVMAQISLVRPPQHTSA